MSKTKMIVSYLAEAKHYNLSNYPSVKLHWKCNETSGTDMVDEVLGLIIRPNQEGGTISFGSPAYSVDPECAASPDTPIIGGNYPTFHGTKFVLNLGIGRCTDATAGRVDIGCASAQHNGTPVITTSFISGIHTVFIDDAAITLTPADASPPNLTLATDYAIATIIRPSGGLCGGYLYDSSGTLLHSQTVANSGLGTITPPAFVRPKGLSFYQWIVYEFTAEPVDLLTGIKWHIGSSMQGIKAPYPGWKYRT